MDSDHLKSLKYSELRKLAKKNGVKANLKADKIILALLEKFARSPPADETVKQNEEKTSEDAVKRRSRKRGRNVSQGSEEEVVPAKTVVKDLLTPVQKSAVKVRLVTPSSFITPKTGTYITPSSRVVNMPKSATPHPRKSTGAKGRVEKNMPRITENEVKSKSRRTSPRIAEQEKQNEEEKKVRRSTFEVKIDGTTTNDKTKDGEPAKVMKQPTNIPRFSAFLASKKKATSSATKDWSKLHQKQFEKMESIDDYLARKRKRTEELSSSVKKAKTLTERTKSVVCAMQAYQTPPASASKKSIIAPPSFQSPKVFVPKVVSTKNMSVKFDKTTKTTSVFVFKGKGAVTKSTFSSARKSTGASARKSAVARTRKSLLPSARKSVGTGDARKSMGSAMTPFALKGTGNMKPSPVSAKKSIFDLKASLAKPLSYKPYKGKLSNNKKLTKEQAKENLKKPKVMSMAERRVAAAKQRGQRKTKAINARRGIDV
ncbi:nucleolar and spindle-associated protein 1-like [Antedon mediterranea]|uniref:nucleolar and spindle-associated protein 1-like n=1 Tax=Antedon mediterranea TaxID=105859 RepID=UPI003AF8D646